MSNPFFNAPSGENSTFYLGNAMIDSNITVNTAATQYAFAFVAERTDTLNGIKFYCPLIVGSGGTCAVDLYAVDANGFKTGSSLASGTATPSSAMVTVTFGAGYALTAGTAYVLVIRNSHATPASNYFRLQYSANSALYSGGALQGTSDSGTSWGYFTRSGGVPIILTYNTGPTDVGVILSSLPVTNSSIKLYNTSGSRVARLAVKINVATNLYVHGVQVGTWAAVGSPTHDMLAEICSSSASLSTSDTKFKYGAMWAGGGAFWNTPYELTPGTDYYIGILPSGATAGDGSNYYRIQTAFARQLTPGTILGPMQGSYSSTRSTVSWSSDDHIPDLNILVSPKDSGGGSASILCQRGMNGGFPR